MEKVTIAEILESKTLTEILINTQAQEIKKLKAINALYKESNNNFIKKVNGFNSRYFEDDLINAVKLARETQLKIDKLEKGE